MNCPKCGEYIDAGKALKGEYASDLDPQSAKPVEDSLENKVMIVLPKWLKNEARAQRLMRQGQRRITSAEALKQYERVEKESASRATQHKNMSNESGWIGCDLDGTLAHYEGWQGSQHIGEPITPMLERVKKWLASGRTVKIFTARMHGHGMPIIGGSVEDMRTPIEEWCLQHIGQVLEVTNVKDFGMIELWDDRAIQVESNTGIPVVSCKFHEK